MFKSLVGKDHPEFKSARQQDAMEYFFHLLDQIKRAEKKAHASDPGLMFEFEMEQKLQC